MRIVHLVIGSGVAGGQVVAAQVGRAARARGDEVTFVCPGPGPFAELVESEGFSVAFADLNRTLQVRDAVRLRRLLRRADLLHTHTLAAANVLSRLASPAPVVSHLHIENPFRPATRWLLSRLDNTTARSCARLIAVSDDTRRAYERQGYPGGRIEVVYNGVELDGKAPGGTLRTDLGIPDSTPLIGEVARLCDVKGQSELINAMPHLPGARLVLIGADLEQGGAFQERLEHEADLLGVRDRVVFAGYREGAAHELGDLDVLALPSWTEGLPLVVLEAMAQGRPVVASAVGGTPELVVNGETGLLVPPRDSHALAGAIHRLLEDPELRRRMGETARQRVAESFSADTMTRRMLEIYDEVAG